MINKHASHVALLQYLVYRQTIRQDNLLQLFCGMMKQWLKH